LAASTAACSILPGVLLIDHQSGLFQLVKDIDLPTQHDGVVGVDHPLVEFGHWFSPFSDVSVFGNPLFD
jgi:hypothetical protein